MDIVDKLKKLSSCHLPLKHKFKCNCFECSGRTIFNMDNISCSSNNITFNENDLLNLPQVTSLEKITLFNVKVKNLNFIRNTNIRSVSLHYFGDTDLSIDSNDEHYLDALSLFNGNVVPITNNSVNRVNLSKTRKVDLVDVIWKDDMNPLHQHLRLIETLLLKRVQGNIDIIKLINFPLLTDFTCIDMLLHHGCRNIGNNNINLEEYQKWKNDNHTAKRLLGV
jgi:hypothetical protein